MKKSMLRRTVWPARSRSARPSLHRRKSGAARPRFPRRHGRQSRQSRDFKPAMDDLMTMLIQPRHLKLHYAGEAKNWELAEFQLRELRHALARIGRTIPNYRKNGVDDAVASIFTEKAVAVKRRSRARTRRNSTRPTRDDRGVQRLPRRVDH